MLGSVGLDGLTSSSYPSGGTGVSIGLGDRMVRRFTAALFAFATLSLATGCVERRFRVESNPPGAYVSVNNVPYGPTPVDIPFLFYGEYEIELKKDGFQTIRTKEEIRTPWYQWPLVDFVSETVWPTKITDTRPLHYDLEPAIQPNLDLLKAEAEELRKRGLALPEPRYPNIDKDRQERKAKEKKEKESKLPKKDTPSGTPAGPDALPPPREVPGTLSPETIEPRL
jgi:PEGA domain